jgi:aminoglycoside 2''-phosphotransferase
MSGDTVADALRAALPELGFDTVESVGEGDYCEAYAVDGEWIVLVARHEGASRSLARSAALLPALAPTLPLPIPDIVYFGRLSAGGRACAAYRRIDGTELTPDRFRALPDQDQERCAAGLGLFLRGIHSFPVDVARRAGAVECIYPFCATEEGVAAGVGLEQYQRDLERLLGYPEVDEATRNYCRRILARYLEAAAEEDVPAVLLHGEVSADHVLFDPETRRLTGVIDFNGAIIGDPARDLLYLYEEYGLPFLRTLLDHYPAGDRGRLLARLHFPREWHTVLRLLWALEHAYAPGVARRSEELRDLRREAEAPPWRALLR